MTEYACSTCQDRGMVYLRWADERDPIECPDCPPPSPEDLKREHDMHGPDYLTEGCPSCWQSPLVNDGKRTGFELPVASAEVFEWLSCDETGCDSPEEHAAHVSEFNGSPDA